MFMLLCQTTGQWSITLVVIWPIHSASLLSSHLHKVLVGLIVCNCRFQVCLLWLVILSQFYRKQVLQSIYKSDLKQSKWKKIDLSNGSEKTNPAVTPTILPFMIKVIQRYETNGFSVFIKSMMSHDL